MLDRILSVFFLSFVLFFGNAGVSSFSAQAAVFGGSIRHYSPDRGYDRPFRVVCDNEEGDPAVHFIHEGQHSDSVCPDEDVNFVSVRSGEEYWCISGGGREGRQWIKRWDATGLHPISNLSNPTCVVAAD